MILPYVCTVELHLSELVRGQTVYIIGVRIIGAGQLSLLSITSRSYNRSSCSDEQTQLFKVQLFEHQVKFRSDT